MSAPILSAGLNGQPFFKKVMRTMKSFDIPTFYHSRLITDIKNHRNRTDVRKKDYAPTLLDFGPIRFLMARHFGFCYGVQHAIEIAYRALNENPERRIYLLSEMIHNPDVNRDLTERGIRFIMDPSGNQKVGWDELRDNDIVIIPAFGTTVEVQKKLESIGIKPQQYDATCPFVQKVWNKGRAIGQEKFTVIIHGKPSHEETKATFSHIAESTAAVIVKDLDEAARLGDIMLGIVPPETFYETFRGQYSEGFDVNKDLERLGVVNQTTMLASDTKAIADRLKQTMMRKYRLTEAQLPERFADTLDTLCYATHDNQKAVYRLLEEPADLAIVAGGYNSSNTSHLVTLCRSRLPTYHIASSEKILSRRTIRHYSITEKREIDTQDFLPAHSPVTVSMTSGASCPDIVVENIIARLVNFFSEVKPIDEVRKEILKA